MRTSFPAPALMLLATAGLTGALLAADPTVGSMSESTSADGKSTTYSFSIDPKGNTVKDIHLTHAEGNAFPAISDSTAPAGWSGGRTVDGKRIRFNAGTGGDAAAAGASFSVTVKHPKDKPPGTQITTVRFTSTGTARIDPDDTLKYQTTTFTVPGGGTGDFKFPVLALNAAVNPGSTLVVGGVIRVDVSTEALGSVYDLHVATALAESEDADPLGIGLDVNAPLPPAWRVRIEGERAPLRAEDGRGRAQPRIILSENPELAGKTLYIVATIDLNSDGVPDVFNVPPLAVTIGS